MKEKVEQVIANGMVNIAGFAVSGVKTALSINKRIIEHEKVQPIADKIATKTSQAVVLGGGLAIASAIGSISPVAGILTAIDTVAIANTIREDNKEKQDDK